MTQKSLLITGASSGIGYDAAHGLSEHGWRVFATCRSEADCARLRDEGLESFRLDQTDAASITEALAEATKRTGSTLDALFVNGAYGLPAAAEDLPTNAMRAIFETNFFGVHEIARQAIPILRAQGGGRFVATSSVLGFATIPWRAAYASTKFALEGYCDTLRMELKPDGIDVVLIEPGPITSRFRRNAAEQFFRWVDWENSHHRAAYEAKLLPRMRDMSDKRDPFELPASAVTRKLIRALEAPRPKPRYWVTTPTYAAGIGKRFLPTRLVDWLQLRT